MIVPEGWPLILISACLGAAAVALGWPVVGWGLTGFALLSLIVFRDPPRVCSAPDDVACSPADGIVESLGPVPGADAGLGTRIVLRIPPLAPQITRLPTAGSLVEVTRESAAGFLLRECVTSVWQTPWGRLVLRQIAGRFAHRIVFDRSVGQPARRATRIGVLRFGSRVEVELPGPAEAMVAIGDRVRAGETPLARMTP